MRGIFHDLRFWFFMAGEVVDVLDGGKKSPTKRRYLPTSSHGVTYRITTSAYFMVFAGTEFIMENFCLVIRVVWLRAGRPGDRGSIPGRGERIFPVLSAFRQALGPTQPPVQWVLGVLSAGLKRGRGVTLTTHPRLMPMSGMSRSYTSPPKAPSWRVVGQL
jgi:hypothetical protein